MPVLLKSKITEESEHTTPMPKEKFDNFSCWQKQPVTLIMKKMSNLEKKRRFADEQVRALEIMFESEKKLDPRKKLQLAKELGLQPRQIAIWFQNRRARWKATGIEKEYRKLRVDYDNLLSRFEFLKKENESLQDELERLRDRTGRSHEAARENEVVIKGNNIRGGGLLDDEKMIKWEADNKASCSNGGLVLDGMGGLHLLDEKTGNCSFLNNKNGPLAPTEKWYSIDPCGMLDQSCNNSHWLDTWT